MDIFGMKKRRATQAAIDYCRPMIGTIQHVYGLPPRFWSDDFVLGFFVFMIAITARMTAGDLSTVAKGQGLMDAFTALSNQNGSAIATRAITLSETLFITLIIVCAFAVPSFGKPVKSLKSNISVKHDQMLNGIIQNIRG